MNLVINTGEYLFRLGNISPRSVLADVQYIYGSEATQSSLDTPVDFEVSLNQAALLRRFIRPQVTFSTDQQTPFKPMPKSQAYPVLEWGMNWCIAAYDFNRFIVHAAVLEKNGKAVMFPAAPGSGKSTLTAFLSQNGWNLFSDEMTIIDFKTNLANPMYRPVSLKNESIDLVKNWFPDSVFSNTALNTQKGDVALFKAIDWDTFSKLQKTEIVGVIFPKYDANIEQTTIYTMNQIQGFEQLATNAFNYNITGLSGFETVSEVIKSSKQFEIHYNDVADVNDFLIEEII